MKKLDTEKVKAVFNNESKWACVKSKAVDFMASLPDNSIDLLFTSPPYEDQRAYGEDNRNYKGEGWVKWMIQFVEVAAPKVRGLIAINCEGKTSNFSYSCTPFLLMADLKRMGYIFRKPPIFQRYGIQGSGGNDWFRNDYEPILCITRKGKLPWSNNTACGKPPVYPPGGANTNRKKNGERVEKEIEVAKEPLDIANPGNVLRLKVGGGHMGHALAHEGQAPFPVMLPEFFIESCCPVGGIVCDPFVGTGTTIQAAVSLKRRFIGCDIDHKQVNLCHERMETVTVSLF